MENEIAFTICKCGDRLVKGSEATGKPDTVKLTPSCECGTPVGIHHTHPGADCTLSQGDIVAAKIFSRDFNVNPVLMCVEVPEKHQTKCYQVKR